MIRTATVREWLKRDHERQEGTEWRRDAGCDASRLETVHSAGVWLAYQYRDRQGADGTNNERHAPRLCWGVPLALYGQGACAPLASASDARDQHLVHASHPHNAMTLPPSHPRASSSYSGQCDPSLRKPVETHARNSRSSDYRRKHRGRHERSGNPH